MTIQHATLRPEGMTESDYAHCISRLEALKTLIVKHKMLRVVCPWASHGKLLEIFRAQKAAYRATLCVNNASGVS